MISPQELEGLKFMYESTKRLTAAVLIYAVVLFIVLTSGLTPGIGIPAIISFGLFISGALEFYKASKILALYHDIFRIGKVVMILLTIPLVDILGVILFGVLLTSLGRNYRNGLLSLGGILTAIPFTLPLGVIISLIALKRAWENPNLHLGSQAVNYNWGGSAPNTSPQNGRVVQVGVGRIKGGQANFRLYAYQEVYIRDVILEGYPSHATSVMPSHLVPGSNDVSVYLSPEPMLPVNTVHKLVVILSDNSIVNVKVENRVQ